MSRRTMFTGHLTASFLLTTQWLRINAPVLPGSPIVTHDPRVRSVSVSETRLTFSGAFTAIPRSPTR